MSSIVVTGWKPGFDKVGMNRLLREQFGYSLGEAKHAVDEMLENREVRLTLAAETLEKLTRELEKLGAVFRAQS